MKYGMGIWLGKRRNNEYTITPMVSRVLSFKYPTFSTMIVINTLLLNDRI